jgi:hypothetical protein
MKKITLLLLLFVSVLSTSVYAVNIEAKQTPQEKTTTNYTLNLGDLTNYSEKEVNSEIQKFLKTLPADELQCSVTVKGSIDVGPVEFEIEVTVSGPCSEIKAKGKEIASQILKDIKKALDDAF